MHRTEGDGYVTESGFRRFVDQNLPSTPGTVHPAEWDNAVQEELCYLITAAGLTVAPTAIADRSAGWHQLYDAIFDSEALDTGAIADGAITNDKVTSCGFSKLIYNLGEGGVDVSRSAAGEVFQLEMEPAQLLFTRTNGATEEKFSLTGQLINGIQRVSGTIDKTAGVSFSGFSASDWVTYSTIGSEVSAKPINGLEHTYHDSGSVDYSSFLTYNGLSFVDRNVAAGYNVRFRVINCDAISWSGTGPWSATIPTNLLTDRFPLMATYRYRRVSTGYVIIPRATDTSPTYNTQFAPSGGYWTAIVTVNDDQTGATFDQKRLIVWYG